MKIGFFGGSFDPPHLGHIALARLAADRLELDRVLLAPVGRQPLKGTEAAPFADRVAMLRLAMADDPRLELSLLDAPNPDGQPNYTVETLRRLRAGLPPEARVFCIIGADSFLSLNKWREPTALFAECDLVVGARPGFPLDVAAWDLPQGVSLDPSAVSSPGGRARIDVIPLRHPRGQSTLYLLPDLAEDVSATEIRQERGSGHHLDPAVAAYIREHGLYRGLSPQL